MLDGNDLAYDVLYHTDYVIINVNRRMLSALDSGRNLYLSYSKETTKTWVFAINV